tara:strand:- start:2938 stop:3168 length:231 start_codon:yes stop_codon:yes gene_type:complete
VEQWWFSGKVLRATFGGRLLFLNNDYNGLNGNNDLDNNGRFVGIVKLNRLRRFLFFTLVLIKIFLTMMKIIGVYRT